MALSRKRPILHQPDDTAVAQPTSRPAHAPFFLGLVDDVWHEILIHTGDMRSVNAWRATCAHAARIGGNDTVTIALIRRLSIHRMREVVRVRFFRTKADRLRQTCTADRHALLLSRALPRGGTLPRLGAFVFGAHPSAFLFLHDQMFDELSPDLAHCPIPILLNSAAPDDSGYRGTHTVSLATVMVIFHMVFVKEYTFHAHDDGAIHNDRAKLLFSKCKGDHFDNVNAQVPFWHAVLSYASVRPNNQLSCGLALEASLGEGADPNRLDYRNCTALMAALDIGCEAELVLSVARHTRVWTSKSVNYTLDRSKNGWNVLHFLCAYHNIREVVYTILKLMQEQGVDIASLLAARDDSGCVPLLRCSDPADVFDVASSSGYSDTADRLEVLLSAFWYYNIPCRSNTHESGRPWIFDAVAADLSAGKHNRATVDFAAYIIIEGHHLDVFGVLGTVCVDGKEQNILPFLALKNNMSCRRALQKLLYDDTGELLSLDTFDFLLERVTRETIDTLLMLLKYATFDLDRLRLRKLGKILLKLQD